MRGELAKPFRITRKSCLREKHSATLGRIVCGILSIIMVLGMGCASRQKVNVKSEGLPPEQKQIESVAKPGEREPIVGQKKTPAPFSSEGEISEFPLPGDQIAGDQIAKEKPQTPGPGKLEQAASTSEEEKVPSPVEPSDIPLVPPLPLLEEERVDLSKVPRTLTDIFFDYDQYRIRQDAITVLEANAKVLIWRFPNKKVIIQGHCDERGTREYNLVLGERRAQAVRNYLIDLGVPEGNIQVISYGKEKPFCIEHSKKCWQKNRRSHFVVY